MAGIINWVQTQNQENVVQVKESKPLEQYVVANKLEKAYQKNNIIELTNWLTYAQVFHVPVEEKRKFFKKIKELWPLSRHPELANAFHFLNAIYAERYTERNDSAQICNHSALISEFSYF